LGKEIKIHPKLETVRICKGELDLASIQGKGDRKVLEEVNPASNIRDCGAGILSECLPPGVTKLNVNKCGLGACGYKILAAVSSLEVINGVPLDVFTESAIEIDLSQSPLTSGGASACILAKLLQTPNLTSLDLSGSQFSTNSYSNGVLTRVIHSGGHHSCDGGCDRGSYEGTMCCLVSTSLADVCSTCCYSEDPLTGLAKTVDRLPNLKVLKISNCSFVTQPFYSMIDYVGIKAYTDLGLALSKHVNITDLDISDNHAMSFPELLKYVALMPALRTVALNSRQGKTKREPVRIEF
jgi:hypothetical protein